MPISSQSNRIEYELSAEELPCPVCGLARTKIGEELSEQLEYVPSSLFVIVHARFRYACRPCQEHVALADKPPQPIDKGLPGPGLLAHTITSLSADISQLSVKFIGMGSITLERIEYRMAHSQFVNL